ncbi:MAG: FtsB family cell division protein [Desulfovibrio sp.]|uniref:FtsB family cell division protein n=1 Tax=Desulfovibrio sp. 7SRBS1 TaxID=3378064 RepID=UPI003B3D6752
MVLRHLFLLLLAGGNIFLLFLLFISDQGVNAYLEMAQRHERLLHSIQQTEDHSRRLSREIRWLKSNKKYMEQVIRSKTNFVKEDEVLYLFPETFHNATAGEQGE